MNFPRMIKVKQKLRDEVVINIPETVGLELRRIGVQGKIKQGDTVSVTVGSRGINNINVIIKSIIDSLKEYGARPFIVPAMGSHGGATAQGQMEVLAHYGITEEFVGAPIKATMEVVEIGTTEDGVKVYIDKFAYKADHILVVNRIKPHTDFYGEIESGLHKIMAIGLGKHQGAEYYHQAAVRFGLERIIYTVGQVVLKAAPILCGVGIIENGYDETAEIRAVKPEEIESEEKALLKKAKQFIAELPFDDVDILVVDAIGKNISGTGMDTNVIGRFYTPLYASEPVRPRIKRILVSDLTKESEGNALGVGIADFCNDRIIEKMDRRVTYTNALTGLGPEKARLPISFPTDREMLEVALKTIGLVPPEEAKVIHIRTTLHLEYIEISTAYEEETKKREDLEIVRGPEEIRFDTKGNFVPLDRGIRISQFVNNPEQINQ